MIRLIKTSLQVRPPPYLTCLWRKGRIDEIFPHDANIAAQLSRIVYWKQVHHLGCPSARKCGVLCFSAKKKTHVAPRSSYSRIPTFVRTKSRRACAEAALRAAAILVRSGEATVILAYRSGRLSIARDRFEVLGVRGDINKSTTFGTEDKCDPLEVTTLRSLTATEIGAGTAT